MESFNEALVECIKKAGGSKQVGPLLWPEKDPIAAQRRLLDCLKEDRPDKLSPDQVLYVLRLARDKGYHGGMDFILAYLGYAPTVPVEPRDEVAELQRMFMESVAQQARLTERMERAASRVNLRSIA